MNNKQKGFVLPIIITIVALLVLGGGAYIYINKKPLDNQAINIPDVVNNIPISTTTKTSDWKVYTNTQYGFEVKYPSGWKITDKSMTDSTTNTKYPSVNIESPLRYDLPGYKNIATSYRILIYRPEAEIISIADFGSNEKPAQSWWNTNVNKTTKEATGEYKVGQQIISSFKFISAEQISSNKFILNSISGPKNLDVGQSGTWKINTSAPVGTDISYAVDYGDNTAPTFGADGNGMISSVPSFTHSYNKAGTYTLTFSATEQKKGADTIRTTFTVVVDSLVTENVTGIIKGIVENMTSGKKYINIDYVTINPNWKPGGMSGSIYTNDNTQIRTFEISNDTKFIIDQNKNITLSEFQNIFTTAEYRANNPWDIVINNGFITEVKEHCIP